MVILWVVIFASETTALIGAPRVSFVPFCACYTLITFCVTNPLASNYLPAPPPLYMYPHWAVRGRATVLLRHQRVPLDDSGKGHGHDPEARVSRDEVRDSSAAQTYVPFDRAAEFRCATKGKREHKTLMRRFMCGWKFVGVNVEWCFKLKPGERFVYDSLASARDYGRILSKLFKRRDAVRVAFTAFRPSAACT